MAVFIPDELRGRAAADYFEEVYQYYRGQLKEHEALLREISQPSKLGDEIGSSKFTAMLTIEGGAVLAGDPAAVEVLAAKGVRMMTLTWNGANELCGGFASGGGFTAVGREAVRRMEACGMAVDVSHLSDEGFFELCGFAEKPFVASHSNARAICSHPRNLTDDMFREIVMRKGLVGLNYYDTFILDGGGSVRVEELLRHIHRFLELGGEDIIAIGSDFDGAALPEYIRGNHKLGCLIDGLERSGVPEEVAEKILWKNAARFFVGNSIC
jgi:membrane dipeptidase